jgi:hypothetical protein
MGPMSSTQIQDHPGADAREFHPEEDARLPHGAEASPPRPQGKVGAVVVAPANPSCATMRFDRA